MRVSRLLISNTFKRFGSLEINSLAESIELVVMLGPNGSGKSSVFDAFIHWGRQIGRPGRRSVSATYFNTGVSSFGVPEVDIHESSLSQTGTPIWNQLHVRTAHRNTPDVLTDSLQHPKEFGANTRVDRMIETDQALREHYQRLAAGFLPILANLDNSNAAQDLEKLRGRLAPLQEALNRVLPHLHFTGLGDPTSEGSFYFTRDGTREFRYENLSGGEKAVFDLFLDVHLASLELKSPLVCLDEPEIHLNPNVQASVLNELMGLLPSNSQMWIATHSVGMIRKAFDIAVKHPNQVAFLDFGVVSGPSPSVVLTPIQPSRQLLQDALAVALDDLASLLAPAVLVVCEGSQLSSNIPVWDQRIYRQIFRHLHQQVDFVSGGGKGELAKVSELAALIAPGTHILKLRDRDDLPDEHRQRMLQEDLSLRILKRHSLESYLLDDEILAALVDQRGPKSSDALSQLKAVRDSAMMPNGSAKGALGVVFTTAKRVLVDAGGLGENKHQFSADVLAALFQPSMDVTTELVEILDLDSIR